MGKGNFNCIAEPICAGTGEQFDWTPTVVIGLPVGPEGSLVHVRGDYNAYGKFMVRVVHDDESAEKENVGEYDALGKCVRPANLPEISTLVVAAKDYGDDIFPETTHIYCFGAYQRFNPTTEESVRGTRYCAPTDVRIFMGITLSELAVLRPEEAAELRPPPPAAAEDAPAEDAAGEARAPKRSRVEQPDEPPGANGVDRVIDRGEFTLKQLQIGVAFDKGRAEGGLSDEDLAAVLKANGSDDAACGVPRAELRAQIKPLIDDFEKRRPGELMNTFLSEMGMPVARAGGATDDGGRSKVVGVGLHRRLAHGVLQGRNGIFDGKFEGPVGWQVQIPAEKRGEVEGDAWLTRLFPAKQWPNMPDERPPEGEDSGPPPCALM